MIKEETPTSRPNFKVKIYTGGEGLMKRNSLRNQKTKIQGAW
jgi:hypothetical protein